MVGHEDDKTVLAIMEVLSELRGASSSIEWLGCSRVDGRERFVAMLRLLAVGRDLRAVVVSQLVEDNQ